jgi:hypothetical protein
LSAADGRRPEDHATSTPLCYPRFRASSWVVSLVCRVWRGPCYRISPRQRQITHQVRLLASQRGPGPPGHEAASAPVPAHRRHHRPRGTGQPAVDCRLPGPQRFGVGHRVHHPGRRAEAGDALTQRGMSTHPTLFDHQTEIRHSDKSRAVQPVLRVINDVGCQVIWFWLKFRETGRVGRAQA